MARHRTHSIAFKRQVVEDYLSGEESLHGLAKRHDICRNLIRIGVGKHEAGAFDEEVEAAALLQEYEVRIAALERKVDQLTMENDFLKRASTAACCRSKDVNLSVVSGPKASLSPKGDRARNRRDDVADQGGALPQGLVYAPATTGTAGLREV